MELHGKHILAGATSAEGREEFFGIDPTTGARLEPAFVDATQVEIDHALAAADAAYQALKQVDAARRAGFLRAAAAAIEALGAPLLERGSQETGLPLARLTMERGRTCNQLRMFADLIDEGSWVEARLDSAQPDRTPIPKPDLRRMLVPLGPVVVFGASNFPLAFSVAGGDTASALAAGCPVVVKAHPNHPGTSELVGRAITEAAATSGMPAGVFSLIHGRTAATGAALVAHPSTKAVGFTGSLAGGRALFDLAAARPEPIPVFAEMGSINPVFVLPGALAGDRAEQLAVGLGQSVLLGVGQFCTNPGLVVVPAGADAERLVTGLADTVRDNGGTMLHAGIGRGFAAGLARQREVEGVSEVAAGGAADATGCAVQGSVLVTDASTFLSQPVLHEEVFGPATVVVNCTDAAEMLMVAQNLGGQLTATVHGTEADFGEHADLLGALQDVAGRLVCNGFPTGVEVGPAMHHGGPYPASTDARTTSVGTAAIQRFARPLCYQDMPEQALPPELQAANPRGILRMIDGAWSRDGGGA